MRSCPPHGEPRERYVRGARARGSRFPGWTAALISPASREGRRAAPGVRTGPEPLPGAQLGRLEAHVVLGTPLSRHPGLRLADAVPQWQTIPLLRTTRSRAHRLVAAHLPQKGPLTMPPSQPQARAQLPSDPGVAISEFEAVDAATSPVALIGYLEAADTLPGLRAAKATCWAVQEAGGVGR